MMDKLKFWLYKILSWSPILRITDDSKYNRVEKGATEFRISIFSCTIGIYSFYFITWNHDKKFNIFYKLNLYDVQGYQNNIESFEDQYDDYLEELSTKEEVNKAVEKEFLSKRMSEIEIQKSKTFNKFLAYIALVVFILPLYAPKLTKIFSYLGTYKFIYVIIMSCIILNLVFLIYEILKVKNSKRVIFNSIRESSRNQAENNLIAMLFYEWKNLNNESILEVALVKNMEKYMSMLILISLFIIISSNVETLSEKAKEKTPDSPKNALVFTISRTKESTFPKVLQENNKKIDIIKNDVLSGEYSQVILVSDVDDKISDNLAQLINLYKDHNVRVVEVRKKDYPKQIEVILTKE